MFNKIILYKSPYYTLYDDDIWIIMIERNKIKYDLSVINDNVLENNIIIDGNSNISDTATKIDKFNKVINAIDTFQYEYAVEKILTHSIPIHYKAIAMNKKI